MKKRTLNYLRKSKARNIFSRVAEVDLKTFLSAAQELCYSSTVKRHVEKTLQRLDSYQFGIRA
jgi:transcription initiation factor TFIIIB Brf1 subunit/transcription initiation factor TFIIB